MDLANAILVPTQGATKVGTLFAIAQLVPTREAAKVGTGFAWGKPRAATTDDTRNQV